MYRHILVDMFGVDFKILNNAGSINDLAMRMAEKSKMEIIEKPLIHSFDPQGVTVLLMLAESHLLIHTWPERGYVVIDLFCCDAKATPSEGVAYAIQILKPESHNAKLVYRGRDNNLIA